MEEQKFTHILLGWACGEPYHARFLSLFDAQDAAVHLDDSHWAIHELGAVVRVGNPRTIEELAKEAIFMHPENIIRACGHVYRTFVAEHGYRCGLAEAKYACENEITRRVEDTLTIKEMVLVWAARQKQEF